MTDSYTVLSLDLGTNTGWAFIKDGTVKHSGVLALPDSTTHPGHRFIKFSNWLNDFRGVDEIFYEIVPGFRSAAAARVHCGLLAIMQMFCIVHRKGMIGIRAKSVKKEFTGNGNADKLAMCAVAHKLGWRGGHPSTDIQHDEADAIACAWAIFKRRGADLKIGDANAAPAA